MKRVITSNLPRVAGHAQEPGDTQQITKDNHMPTYTIEFSNGYYWLLANGLPCKRYTTLSAAQNDNPGVKFVG